MVACHLTANSYLNRSLPVGHFRLVTSGFGSTSGQNIETYSGGRSSALVHSSELSVRLSRIMRSLANRTSDFRTLLISGLSVNFSIATNNGRQLLSSVELDGNVQADDSNVDDFGAKGTKLSSLEEPLEESLGVKSELSLGELSKESPLDGALERRPIASGGAAGTTDSKLSFIKFFVN